MRRHVGLVLFGICSVLVTQLAILEGGQPARIPWLHEDDLGIVHGVRFLLYGIGLLGLFIYIQDLLAGRAFTPPAALPPAPAPDPFGLAKSSLQLAHPPDSAAVQKASFRARATLPHFIGHIRREDSSCSALIQLLDPLETARTGHDIHAHLWLDSVTYHRDIRTFCGALREVPAHLASQYRPSQRLSFEPRDILDWTVLEKQTLHGGHLLRLIREHLPEPQRPAFDRALLITTYAPLPAIESSPS